MGIGHSPRECSPLHHGEVPTHAGAPAWCIRLKTARFTLSDSPMAMTSGKVQILFLHHWCQMKFTCRPVELHSKLFAEMSRNSAGTF